MRVHLRPEPDTVVLPCGLNSSSTEGDYEACMKPLLVAAAARWGTSIDSITMLHEAIGAFSSGVPFSKKVTSQWVNTFLSNTALAIRAVSSTVRLGAAAETMFAGDAAYFHSYLTNSSLDYVAVDLYGSTCDVAQYDSTVLATAVSWAASAKAAGMDIRIEESARPRWLSSTCASPTESNALVHEGYADYSTSGADVTWLETIVPYVAAAGYTGFSMCYSTNMLLWYTLDIDNADPEVPAVPSYDYDLLSNLPGPSPTGVVYKSFAP
jgi:hypothetical protein